MASISITAPDSAKEGDVVSASVTVTSTLGYHASYKGDIKAVPDLYPDYVIGSIDQIILAGDSITVDVSFTMPDCAVTIFLYLERWSFDHWVPDSSDSEVVSLEVPEVVPCEITIDAPSSAEEGETVSVSALIENVSSYGSMYKTEISAVPDLYPAFRIGTIEKYIDSGESFTAYGSFIMPDCNTTVFVRVERWAVDHWVYDNSASRAVSLEVPVPETFHLSVYVPPWAAGGYVEPGSGDYPANETVKLTAHPLDGYQFTGWGGDASGTDPTYDLYMDSDKYVEAYFEPVPVPEYKGTISKKELEYDGTKRIIPVY